MPQIAKPTALKILQGNPGKKPLNDSEPIPPQGIPEPPKWMSKTAKQGWAEIAPVLHEMGVLTMADGIALQGLCVAYANWVDAVKYIDKNNPTYEVTLSQRVTDAESATRELPRPQVAIANSEWEKVSKMLAKFGMTPSDRSKIKLEWKQANELDEFMQRRPENKPRKKPDKK